MARMLAIHVIGAGSIPLGSKFLFLANHKSCKSQKLKNASKIKNSSEIEKFIKNLKICIVLRQTQFDYNKVMFQSLLRLSSCGVIRYLTLISEAYPPSNFLEGERQLSWIFYHFPYLERFNNDQIDDKLTPTYIVQGVSKKTGIWAIFSTRKFFFKNPKMTGA
jgi:hypothetical protein